MKGDHRLYVDSAKYMWTELQRCKANLVELILNKANGKVTEATARKLAQIAKDEMVADGSWVVRDENGYKHK